jgi:hypothetical protein
LRLADETNSDPDVVPGDSFMYFAVDSGLPLALEKAPRVERGYREVQRFKAWESLGDLQLFLRVEVAKGHARGVMKYDFVEIGTVDPEVFAIPDHLEQPAAPRVAGDTDPAPPANPGAGPPEDTEHTALRTDLPPVEEILEKAIDAMGGSAAFEPINTMHLEVEIAAGTRQELHIIDIAPPDRLHVQRPRPDGSVIVLGKNGDFAWWQLPGRPAIRIHESRLEQEKSIARMPWVVLDICQDFETIEAVDRVPFDGRECYKLRLRNPRQRGAGEAAGDRFAYFDVQNGQIVGMEEPLQRDPSRYGTSLYREWKDFGELTLFSRVESTQTGVPQTRIVKAVAVNAVAPAVFEVPAPVKDSPAPAPPPVPAGGSGASLGSSTGSGGS